MNKSVPSSSPTRVGRMLYGLLLGACVAMVLEFINGFCTFLLPPLIILTQLSLISGVLLALAIRSGRIRGTFED
jgi:hypothetical protein